MVPLFGGVRQSNLSDATCKLALGDFGTIGQSDGGDAPLDKPARMPSTPVLSADRLVLHPIHVVMAAQEGFSQWDVVKHLDAAVPGVDVTWLLTRADWLARRTGSA